MLLNAQSGNAGQAKADDPYKEIYSLQKELDGKQRDMASLQAKIDKLTAELEKAKEELKAEKNSGKSARIKELEKTVKQKDAQLAQMQKDSDATAKEAEGKSAAKVSQMEKQHEQDAQQILALTKQTEDLRAELAQLGSFKKMWLQQLAESVDDKWLNKTYSQIDLGALEKACADYAEYAASDPKVKAAHDKLSALLKECKTYSEGLRCVSSPYDAATVQAAYGKVKALCDNTTGVRVGEVRKLAKQLSDYEVTVEIFRDVISAVDKQTEGMPSHKAAWPLVKATLDKQEKDNGYISAINAIPWLDEMYKKYYDSLSKNCLAKNGAADTIKSLRL